MTPSPDELVSAITEIERLRKIEHAAITLRSRCIVEGVQNPKMKEGYHIEVRVDAEAWQQFWDSLSIGNLELKDGLKLNEETERIPLLPDSHSG